MSGINLLRKIQNPELFQGSLHRKGYFEGWYFKLISADRQTALAVIPGVSLARDPAESHAFVQVIHDGRTAYHRFQLDRFSAGGGDALVSIGGNVFGRYGITLDLGEGDSRIAGSLRFTDVLPFPKTALCPGIMGPFGFVPGMECYHGIVNIRHRIAGSLAVGGETVSLDGGAGYVEKDWGKAFPSAWVWVQANHFPGGEAFLFSVADIPWPGGSFRGFFAFLHRGGRLHRFATYTGAKLTRLAESGDTIEAVIQSRDGTLELAASPGPGGLLRAPKNGLMDRTVEESIAAMATVRLKDGRGNVIFEGTSPVAGMERYDSARLTAWKAW